MPDPAPPQENQQLSVLLQIRNPWRLKPEGAHLQVGKSQPCSELLLLSHVGAGLVRRRMLV